MKHKQIKSKRVAGEQRASCSNLSARCSQCTGNAYILWSAWDWGPGLSTLLPAVWALNHHGHTAGFRQMQPTTSEKSVSVLGCRAWQRWTMSSATCIIKGMTDEKQGDECQVIPASHLKSHVKLLSVYWKIQRGWRSSLPLTGAA